jgi:four helix bundle protein
MGDSLVREKSYRFALETITLYRHLTSEREYVLSKQVLRSGTSIGANVEEALAGQSRRDFAAKMAVASKEARECHSWPRPLRDSGLTSGETSDRLLQQCDELVRMLTSIVKTTQRTPRR